jgi:membrane protease YdiL (CAAX protease family)
MMNWFLPILAFSIKAHLSHIARFDLPFLMIVRALAQRDNFFNGWKERGKTPAPRIVSGIFFTAASLFAIALFLSFLASLAGDEAAGPPVEGPGNFGGLAVVLLSCLCTAYLEEGFFRFYLLEKMSLLGRGIVFSVVVSALLFAALHLWEGPWGVFNAAAAAFLLSFVYIETRNLHIAALAHFCYNVAVYLSS